MRLDTATIGKARPFFLYLFTNVVYTHQNRGLLERKLPKIAAIHAPFDMGLYNLHLATGSEKFAVKYALQPCFGLRALAAISGLNSPMPRFSKIENNPSFRGRRLN